MRTSMMRFLVLVACPLVSVFVSACGSAGAQLPELVTVELPDGTSTQVTLGSGVDRLANTTWQFTATSGSAQGVPFLTITFGPDGELESFEDNTIAPEVFGSQILFDGEQHETNQPPLTYAAATYGASTADDSGFAFEGRLNAFAAGLKVATSTAIASGVFDADDPAVMTGTFFYSIDIEVEFPGVPFQHDEDEFGFVAERVE